jgi:hypothetical protein
MITKPFKLNNIVQFVDSHMCFIDYTAYWWIKSIKGRCLEFGFESGAVGKLTYCKGSWTASLEFGKVNRYNQTDACLTTVLNGMYSISKQFKSVSDAVCESMDWHFGIENWIGTNSDQYSVHCQLIDLDFSIIIRQLDNGIWISQAIYDGVIRESKPYVKLDEMVSSLFRIADEAMQIEAQKVVTISQCFLEQAIESEPVVELSLC